MDDWKKAYKAIHGRTPTKKDVSSAPKVLRGDSPKTHSKRSPRKLLSLKRPSDSSFVSPVKKRRLIEFTKVRPNILAEISNIPPSNGEQQINSAEEPPSTSIPSSSNESINLLSPCKNWAPLRRTYSPKKTPQKKAASLLNPKSPSPMKPLSRDIQCRNMKFLIDVKTPVKAEKEEDEAGFEEFEDEKPENAKPIRINDGTQKKKKNSDKNFVKINLRKRNYVKGKPSKFNKKKWLKYKKRT